MNRALVLALAFLAIASRASADTKADAKAHVERGSKAYAAGNYRDALRELTLAYALDPDPELLFAIGQINVKLGDCVSATTFYQRFLDSHPGASEAGVAHQAIEGCATVKPTPPVEPAEPANVVQPVKPEVDTTPPVPVVQPPPPPPAPRPWYSDGAGDAFTGLGILAGGASAVLYWQAVTNRNNADHAATYDAYGTLIDRAHSERAWAIGVGAGAGALVVIGVIHYAIHGSSDGEPEHGVALAPTRGGAMVGYGASF